ncbi:MAG: GNAT family N-acetyltransferase [Myxococcota bacterium]
MDPLQKEPVQIAVRDPHPVTANQTRISYAGLGAASDAYHGYVTYEVSGTKLCIHTISAQPHGDRLGALLLYEMCTAPGYVSIITVEALNVAPEAVGFYEHMGFQKSQSQLALIADMFPNDPVKVAQLQDQVAIYEATLSGLTVQSFNTMNKSWQGVSDPS